MVPLGTWALIDTSVWVTARSGRRPEVARKLAQLVRADQALGHELVHLDLLLGGGGDKRKQLLEDYQAERQDICGKRVRNCDT